MPDTTRSPHADPFDLSTSWQAGGRDCLRNPSLLPDPTTPGAEYRAAMDDANRAFDHYAAQRRPSSGHGSQSDLDALRTIKALEGPTTPRATLDVELTGNLSPVAPDCGIELPWIVEIPLLALVCLLIALGAHSIAVWLSPLIWPQL